MPTTILVVDDKASVRQLLTDYLTQHAFKVVAVANGREALYAARHENPDVMLLDIMMPEMDGYEFLRLYRRERSVPVIILTARDAESDTVRGLELGAEHYVLQALRLPGARAATSPSRFRVRERVARFRCVLRRAEPPAHNRKPLNVGEIVLDEAAHT